MLAAPKHRSATASGPNSCRRASTAASVASQPVQGAPRASNRLRKSPPGGKGIVRGLWPSSSSLTCLRVELRPRRRSQHRPIDMDWTEPLAQRGLDG